MSDGGLELVLLMGLPGAGKSTFAQRFATSHLIVSRDALGERERPTIAEALAAGRSVVVDDTNATPAARASLIALGHAHRAFIVGYHIDTPPRVCVARNRRREGHARVPNVAIFTVAKRFVPPRPEEGFDRLEVVSTAPNSA